MVWSTKIHLLLLLILSGVAVSSLFVLQPYITGFLVVDWEEKWDFQDTVIVDSTIEKVTHGVVFSNHRTKKCEEGIFVEVEGHGIPFEVVDSEFEHGLCTQAVIEFNNIIYSPVEEIVEEEIIEEPIQEENITEEFVNGTQEINITEQVNITETLKENITEEITNETELNITREEIVEEEVVEKNETTEEVLTGATVVEETINYDIYYGKIPKKEETTLRFRDQDNKKIKALYTFFQLKEIILSTKDLDGVSLGPGTYDLEIIPEDSVLKEIKIKNLVLEEGKESFLRISEPTETNEPEGVSFEKIFAIDPTGITFENAEISTVARSEELYKCNDWNFETQLCEGTWEKIMDITNGEQYTFILTPEDPGYGEGGKRKKEKTEFDRDPHGCERCGPHHVPSAAHVNMSISAEVKKPVPNATFSDYYPNDWIITNPNGGSISVYNETYNKIFWYVGTVNDSITRWYKIQAPPETRPVTRYYFQSELDIKSDWWLIIVADAGAIDDELDYPCSTNVLTAGDHCTPSTNATEGPLYNWTMYVQDGGGPDTYDITLRQNYGVDGTVDVDDTATDIPYGSICGTNQTILRKVYITKCVTFDSCTVEDDGDVRAVGTTSAKTYEVNITYEMQFCPAGDGHFYDFGIYETGEVYSDCGGVCSLDSYIDQWGVTTTPDYPPSFTLNEVNTTITDGTVNLSSVISDSVAVMWAYFNVNGTNYTYTGNSTTQWWYLWDCAADNGHQWQQVWANDSTNQWNMTDDIAHLAANWTCDVETPKWTLNSTNDTDPDGGDTVRFNVYWTDFYNVSEYIFSWNGTGASCGTWANDSSVTTDSTGLWTNTSKDIPTACNGEEIYWAVYANDSLNHWNVTDTSGAEGLSGFKLLVEDYPKWRNVQANESSPVQGQRVVLAAEWEDERYDSWAILSTNETGSWVNYTVTRDIKYRAREIEPPVDIHAYYGNISGPFERDISEVMFNILGASANHGEINASDDDWAFTIHAPASNGYQRFEFGLNETKYDVMQVYYEWEGKFSLTGDQNAFIRMYNYTGPGQNKYSRLNGGLFQDDVDNTLKLLPMAGILLYTYVNETGASACGVGECATIDFQIRHPEQARTMESDFTNLSIKAGTNHTSPKTLGWTTWDWANFTWFNNSFKGTLGWRIWVNDSKNQWNETGVQALAFTAVDQPPSITLNEINTTVTSGTINLSSNIADTGGVMWAYFNVNGTNYTYTGNSTTQWWYLWACAADNGHQWNETYANDSINQWTRSIAQGLPLNWTCDITPPQWSNNQTNDTSPAQDDTVKHSVYWTDYYNTSNYIFSWNATGASCDTWANDSQEQTGGGTGLWINVSKDIDSACVGKTIGWRMYALDSNSLGNWNETDIFVYTVEDNPPYFTTAQSNTSLTDGTINLSVLILDDLFVSFAYFDVNDTNYTFTGNDTVERWWYLWACAADNYYQWKEIYANDSANQWNMSSDIPNLPVGFTCDIYAPKYFDVSSNNTEIGEATKFASRWTDYYQLDYCIFSTNNTGSWINDTPVDTSGTAQWCNTTKALNDTIGITVGWRVYSNDTLSHMNETGIQTILTTDTTNPIITDLGHSINETAVGNSYAVLFNVSATDNSGNASTMFNLDGTNYTTTNEYPNFTLIRTCSADSVESWDETWANDSSGNWDSNTSVSLSYTCDATTANWSNAQTNDSDIRVGDTVKHSVLWDDYYALNDYIFEWNVSGSDANASSGSLSSTTDWSNTSIDIPAGLEGQTIRWRMWGNDTFNQLNVSDWQTYVVEAAPKYWFNSTNDTTPAVDETIRHNVYWNNTNNLAQCTFEWNVSGAWVNASQVELSGTADWCNISQTIPANLEGEFISWRQYANGTSGLLNLTYNMYYNISAPPKFLLNEINTTLTDGTVNLSSNINDDDALMWAYFDVNDTNYTYTANSTTQWWHLWDCAADNYYQWKEIYANDSSEVWNMTDDIADLPLNFTCDIYAPKYFDVSSNNTEIGEATKFASRWTDYYQLDYCIFSTNNTGSWINDTPVDTSGTNQWCNSTKILNNDVGLTIGWRVYSNDTLSHMNETGIQTILVADTTNPVITDLEHSINETAVENGAAVLFNVSATDNSGNASLMFNLDGTNYTTTNEYPNFTLTRTCTADSVESWDETWANDSSGNWDSNTSVSLSYTCDATTANWSNVQDNDTVIYSGDTVKHSALWSEYYLLSDWIFEWNASGSDVNFTSDTFIGTLNWSNASADIPGGLGGQTIRWRMWANDSFNQLNVTGWQNHTVLCTDADGDTFNDSVGGLCGTYLDCDDTNATWRPIYNETLNNVTTNLSICTNLYNASRIWIQASDLMLNCQDSTLDGYFDTLSGINMSQSAYDKMTVKNCTIQNYDEGVRFMQCGASDSQYNLITENTITNNAGEGVLLRCATHFNNITNNNISLNEYGVRVSSVVGGGTSNNVSIRGNRIIDNSVYGIFIDEQSTGPNSVDVYNNNLTNAVNGYDDVTGGDPTRWNTTNTTSTNIIGGLYVGGNWYNDSNCYDADGDGFGEDTYAISGAAGSIDYLPLCNNYDQTQSVGYVNVTPDNPSTSDNLNCSFVFTDPNNASFFVNITWWEDGVQYTGADVNYKWYTNNTMDYTSIFILSGNTSAAEEWNCSATAFDSWSYTNYNGTETIANNPPYFTLNEINTTLTDGTVNLSSVISDDIAVMWSYFNVNGTNYTYTANSTTQWWYLWDCAAEEGYQWQEVWANDSSNQWNMTDDIADLPLNFTCDINAPKWFYNSTNITYPDSKDVIRHNIYWTDIYNVSEYIFSWNASGNCDTWGNDSSVTTDSTGLWTNVSKQIPTLCDGKTIGWKVYANDSFNHWNETNTFQYNVTGNNIHFYWEVPTPANDSTRVEDYATLNTTINGTAHNTSAFFDWNYSLVGYWAMDWYNTTAVFDNSTNDNFGKFQGANFGEDNITTGKYGKALVFDGIDDDLNTSYSPEIGITNNFAVEFWMKPTDLWDSAIYLFCKCKDSSNNDWAIIWEWGAADNQTEFFAQGYSGEDPYTGSAITLPDANWHHIVYTYNSTRWSGYRDGEEIFSVDRDFSLQNDTTTWFTIGSAFSFDRWYDGSLDEVRVYTRALTAEEINASYNNALYRLYHNFTSLDDETYYYTAYAIDEAGNFNKTGERRVHIQQSPIITDLGHSINESVVGNSYAVLFNVSATDNSGNASTMFNIDGTNYTTTNEYPNFSLIRTCSADGVESWDETWANDSSGNWDSNTSVSLSYTCDATTPNWSNAQVNDTLIQVSDTVKHSVLWDDYYALNDYIFEWNVSGSDANVSSGSLTSTTDWSNTSIDIPAGVEGQTIRWRMWGNDTFNQLNVSSWQTYVVEAAPKYWFNQTNDTSYNPAPADTITHIALWNDTTNNLAQCTFEWNATGTWTNVSQTGLSGTTDWCNVTQLIPEYAAGETIGWRQYTNDTGNLLNATYIQIYSVKPADVSFFLTLPGQTNTTSNSTGNWSAEINFTALDYKSSDDVNATVVGGVCPGQCQNVTVPIFMLWNEGNLQINWTINLNASLPSYIVLKGKTDNDPTGATTIGTSGWKAHTYIAKGENRSVWLWSDFTDALGGLTVADIYSNSTESYP